MPHKTHTVGGGVLHTRCHTTHALSPRRLICMCVSCAAWGKRIQYGAQDTHSSVCSILYVTHRHQWWRCVTYNMLHNARTLFEVYTLYECVLCGMGYAHTIWRARHTQLVASCHIQHTQLVAVCYAQACRVQHAAQDTHTLSVFLFFTHYTLSPTHAHTCTHSHTRTYTYTHRR